MRTRNLSRHIPDRLTAYSAMAVAVISGASSANAEVVYTDIDDVTISIGDSWDVDIDLNGSLDFHFQAGSAGSGGWTFGSVLGYVNSLSVGGLSNQIVGYPGPYYYYAYALEANELIGPDAAWNNNPSYGNSAVLVSNFYGVYYGAFPGAGEKYLGIKFKIGSYVHYGWMRVQAGLSPAYMTILDYAYEDVAEVPIEAGSQETLAGIPELPAGSIQLYSFGQTLFLHQNGSLHNTQVSIFDLQGKMVDAFAMTDIDMQRDLHAFAGGNYIIHLKSDEGVFSKQISNE